MGINPVNDKEIPIFISDYVLATYGTGAIMAVPAHDDRDWAFARAYDLDIVRTIGPADDPYVFFVNGTPSDCVHIALTGLLPQKPDIVLSGINCGQNMGDDVLYSGTVAAAMEGFLFGCPSFAFSQVHSGWSCLDSAAEVAEYIVDNFIKSPLPAPFLLNVNIPNTTIDQLSGLVVTRLGRRHAAQSVIEQVNPRGETIYWLGAAGDARDSTQGTDFWATSHNYVSVTPLQVDMTNYGMLDTVRTWCNSFQS